MLLLRIKEDQTGWWSMVVGRKGAGGSIVTKMGKDRMETKKAASYSNDGGSVRLVV